VGKTTTALNYSLEFHKVMTLLFAKIEDPLLLLLVQRLGKKPKIKLHECCQFIRRSHEEGGVRLVWQMTFLSLVDAI